MKAAAALLKFLVFFALFLLTSHANAFTSRSLVVIHSHQPASSSANQSIRISIKQMKNDAEPNSSLDSLTNVGLILNPPGDFTSDTSALLHLAINQDCEGDKDTKTVINVESPHDKKILSGKQVAFNDEQDLEIHSGSIEEYNS